MTVKEWLIDWFENNTPFTREEILGSVSGNYLENGWIDSFKFIAFISELENKWSICFSNDEFQDRSFASLDGLAMIIERKINGQ